MNIAIMAHDSKKDLMAQFCTAYAGILSKHQLFATQTTGQFIMQQTGLDFEMVMHGAGGYEQIGTRIELNEMDLVLLFVDPRDSKYYHAVTFFSERCDKNRIPFATNVATAEALVLALDRGDLDWRLTKKCFSCHPIVVQQG